MASSSNQFHCELYFSVDPEKKISQCKVDGCSKTFKGFFPHNLKRHLKTCHKDLAISLNLIEESEGDTNKSEKLKRKKSEYSEKTVKRACVGLVTKRGLPFSFFDYTESKFLLEPILHKTELVINSKNIRQNVSVAAKEVTDIISNVLKNKLFALKIDSASRSSRNIFGVNCQLVLDGSIRVFTIAMLEVFESQTAHNLKNEMMTLLHKFNLSASQIIAITTDNGANMVKAADLMRDEESEALSNDFFEADESDDDFQELITEALSGILIPVRCASHSFQLAVLDVLKNNRLMVNLDKFRTAVKILKRNKYTGLHKNNHLRKPSLDVPTRWGSTYTMLEVMIENQQFYEVEEIGLSDTDWVFGKMAVEGLKPIFILNKRLQTENIIFGDLFKIYLEMDLQIKRLPSENLFKTPLLEAIDKRKTKLFNNTAFLGGLFFDPRFTYRGSKFFPLDKLEETIKYLMNLYERISRLQGNEPTAGNSTVSSVSTAANEFSNDLEELIESQDAAESGNIVSFGIEAKLRQFICRDRQHSSADVLQFWKHTRYAEPEMYKIAEAILGIPCTQVTVERAFSSLPIILKHNRMSLSSENLSNILMVRLNYDLMEQVQFAD